VLHNIDNVAFLLKGKRPSSRKYGPRGCGQLPAGDGDGNEDGGGCDGGGDSGGLYHEKLENSTTTKSHQYSNITTNDNKHQQ